MNDIKLQNLTIACNQKILYKNLSLELREGEITGLYAPTGTGKSTLLNYISGILDEKIFQVQGSITKDNLKVSYIFQEPRLLTRQTVLKNVMLPIEKIYGTRDAEIKALAMLKLVMLDQKANEKACNLSGGEKQRCAIARAFVYPGSILLMDEPFHSQDEQKKGLLIELTKEIVKNENRMVLIVSHDKTDFEKLGATVIKLQDFQL